MLPCRLIAVPLPGPIFKTLPPPESTVEFAASVTMPPQVPVPEAIRSAPSDVLSPVPLRVNRSPLTVTPLLSRTWPPVDTIVAPAVVPKALFAATVSLPVTVVSPAYVLLPLSVRYPRPDFVSDRLPPDSEIGPLIDS